MAHTYIVMQMGMIKIYKYLAIFKRETLFTGTAVGIGVLQIASCE